MRKACQVNPNLNGIHPCGQRKGKWAAQRGLERKSAEDEEDPYALGHREIVNTEARAPPEFSRRQIGKISVKRSFCFGLTR